MKNAPSRSPGTLGVIDDPTTTRGDVIVRNSAGVLARLAKGAANTILSAGANDPAYQTFTALLDAVFGSTRGMLLRRGAAAWEAVAKGATSTILQAGASDPAWATLSAALDTIASTVGGVLVRAVNGTGWTVTPAGTAGQYLRSNGGGVNGEPQWSTPPLYVVERSSVNTFVGIGATRWCVLGGGAGSTEARGQVVMPFPVTTVELHLTLGTAQPGDGDLVITLRVNGADVGTALTVPASSGAGNYGVGCVAAIAAGDLVSVRVVNGAGSNSGNINAVTLYSRILT